MTQPAIPRWDTPWLLPLSTQGFYRAGVGGRGRRDQGLYQKEPQAHPTSPDPADPKEPPLFLRAGTAARVGQAGNSGPGFLPVPIPPLLLSPLGLTLTPSRYPRATFPGITELPPALSRLRCALSPGSTKRPSFNTPCTRLSQHPEQSPQGGRALFLQDRKRGSCHRCQPLLSPGAKVREKEEAAGTSRPGNADIFFSKGGKTAHNSP